MSDSRLHAIVTGVVQGVGFRCFVLNAARELGLRGYVRNVPGGDVEVVAEGPRERLEILESDLRRGPSASTVREVRVDVGEATGRFREFEVAL
jgi:acylphosphatase